MTGASFAVALALWAQGALTFAVAVVLYSRRVPRILRGEIAPADVALDGAAWPKDARQAGNAYANQFELPMLFFVAGAGALWLGATAFEAALCWAFVASRCVHAFIHLTTNRVTRRFLAFAAGVALMAVLWLTLGIRLIIAGVS